MLNIVLAFKKICENNLCINKFRNYIDKFVIKYIQTEEKWHYFLELKIFFLKCETESEKRRFRKLRKIYIIQKAAEKSVQFCSRETLHVILSKWVASFCSFTLLHNIRSTIHNNLLCQTSAFVTEIILYTLSIFLVLNSEIFKRFSTNETLKILFRFL